MQRKTVLLLALIAYSIMMSMALSMFGANTWLTLFVMVVSPTLLMWHFANLKAKSLPWLALGAVAFALLISAVAYVNGIWFEISSTDVRLVGLLPLEAFVAAFVHILFYVTAYEYFFDDSENSGVMHHTNAYLVGVMGIFAIALGYLYLFSHIIVSYAFAWIIFALLLLGGYGVLLLFTKRRILLTRALKFSVAMVPISLAYEWVALSNNLRFFANPNEYLFSFTVFGQLVPLEELLFVLLIPAIVALFYELFFDDAG